MVLFVTGRCHRSCWYCPLSRERKGSDTVFANEHPVDIPSQMIEEAENMSALVRESQEENHCCASTGLLDIAGLLKDHFGTDHHIHLYTAKAPATTN